MTVCREQAKSAVLAELDRQPSEPKAWEEMHLFFAIEAIRRGDYDIALASAACEANHTLGMPP